MREGKREREGERGEGERGEIEGGREREREGESTHFILKAFSSTSQGEL